MKDITPLAFLQEAQKTCTSMRYNRVRINTSEEVHLCSAFLFILLGAADFNIHLSYRVCYNPTASTFLGAPHPPSCPYVATCSSWADHDYSLHTFCISRGQARSPDKTSPRFPPFCSSSRLAPPMVAYSGPHTAIALSVPTKKGRKGSDERPSK